MRKASLTGLINPIGLIINTQDAAFQREHFSDFEYGRKFEENRDKLSTRLGGKISFLFPRQTFNLNIRGSNLNGFFLSNCLRCPFRHQYHCDGAVSKYHRRTCTAGKSSTEEVQNVTVPFPTFLFSWTWGSSQVLLNTIWEDGETAALVGPLYTGNTYHDGVICTGSTDINPYVDSRPIQLFQKIMESQFNEDLKPPGDPAIIDWMSQLEANHRPESLFARLSTSSFNAFLHVIDTKGVWVATQEGESLQTLYQDRSRYYLKTSTNFYKFTQIEGWSDVTEQEQEILGDSNV